MCWSTQQHPEQRAETQRSVDRSKEVREVNTNTYTEPNETMKHTSIQMYTVLLVLSIFLSSLVPTSSVNEDVVCSWNNISIVMKRQTKAPFSVDNQDKESSESFHEETVTPTRSILSLTRGAIRTGRLTAVMGPSGSGKSSFLNVISKRFHNSSTLTSYW